MVRQMRAQKGLTQKALAKKLGFKHPGAQSQLSEWERGTFDFPFNAKQRGVLARLLGLRLSAFNQALDRDSKAFAEKSTKLITAEGAERLRKMVSESAKERALIMAAPFMPPAKHIRLERPVEINKLEGLARSVTQLVSALREVVPYPLRGKGTECPWCMNGHLLEDSHV
jgi:transcriptional regulator with XRE-family HTH domain